MTPSPAAADPSPLASLSGLWPGLLAAALCGAAALGQGAGVALGVAGCLALPLGGLSALAAASRPREESGDGAVTLGVSVVLSAPLLLVFGSVLKANTHHKALAGVTFAIVAAGLVAGALAAGARATQLLRSVASDGAQRVARWGIALLASGVVALLLVRGGLGGLLDVALGLVAAGVAWRLGPAPSRALGAAGLAALALAAAGGLYAARSPATAASIQSRGIVLAWLPTAPAAAPANQEEGSH